MKWVAKLGDCEEIYYRTEFEADNVDEAYEICEEILRDFVEDYFEDVNVSELFFDDHSEPDFVCIDISIPACSICPEKDSCDQEYPCRLTSKAFFIEAYPEE